MDVEGSDFITDWYDSAGEAGRRTLTIEFDQPRLGQVDVLLHGLVARQPENTSVELLAPQTIGVTKLNSSLAVWLSDLYSATVRTSEGWKTSPPEQLSNELQHLRTTPIQFAFRANAAVNQPVIVDLTRQVAQLSADLVTLVAVADDSIDYGLTFRWKISRAAADTFQFTTPDWLKGRLELNVPGVRQISSEATESGDILWTIQLVDAVRNQFLCTGVVTLPPPVDDVIQIPDVQFLDTIVAGKQNPLETQRRCAIIVNRSAGQLVAVDERLVNKIPRDQLPLIVESGLLDQALAITELSSQQALPKWKLVRSAVQDTGRATITGSELVTSLAWDGAWKTRATYTVRNRGQQFLGLKLPENSQLMSVFVKGRPSRTVLSKLNEKTIHLVPLPQTSVVDLSFDVQITLGGQLSTPIQRGARLTAQEVSLPAPDVITRDESAEFGLTVAHTSWRIFTPDKLDVTLVGDRKRSNVDQLTAVEKFATLEIQKSSRIEADVKDQLRVISDVRSDSTKRAQSQNNLKQLGLELSLQCATIETFICPPDPRSVQLYNEAKNLNGRLLAEVTKNSAEVPAVQQAAPQQVLSSNRDFIVGSNSLNYTNNSPDGIIVRGDASVKFEFKVPEAADKKMDRVASKGKQSGGRGALRKSLEGQSFSNGIQGGQQGGGQQGGGQQGGGGGFFGSTNGLVDETQLQPQDQFRIRDEQLMQSRQDKEESFFETLNNAELSFINPTTRSGADSTRTLSVMMGRSTAAGVAGWTQTGGLSLPIEIPTVGSETVFSKVGGSPLLTISLRPRQAWTRSLTWLWSLCWGVLALWVVRRIRTASSAASLRPVLGFVAVLGVLGYLLLPGDLRFISLVMFIVSLIAVMLIGVKREVTNDSASRAA